MPEQATIPESGTAAPSDSIQPVLVDAATASRMMGVSVRTWLTLNRKGLCPRPVLGLRTLRWSVEELKVWGRAGCLPRAKWEPIWQASLRAKR
jgi:hypothetical protein